LRVLLKIFQLLHAAITFVHDAPSRLLIGAT
jgi:hypothetical protein